MPYSEPGKLNELDPDQLDRWNQRLSLIFDRQIALTKREERPSSGRAWLYNPVAAEGPAAEAVISWTAFPKRISEDAPTKRIGWQTADNNRDEQEEYCEWEVVRDPAQQNKVIRVTFTCETEDYYDFLSREAPDLLLQLYRKHVSPAVQLDDLRNNGDYNPQNKWNYPQTVGGHGVLMHMGQTNNAFEAAVNLAGVASWPRVDAAGQPVTGEQPLIACRPFGSERRHSDPHIGAAINALVRGGNEISFADPVGLYIHQIDQSDWETPDGSEPSDWFRIVRGSAEHMLRVVFEAPASAAGYVLGDAKVGGLKIQFGGQLAETLQIRIRGLARPAPQPAPRLGCVRAESSGLQMAGLQDAAFERSLTRLPRTTILLSDE